MESAKPFLGENGEANSKHLINPDPGATAITTQNKNGKSTLLVLVLNKWFKPDQLPRKEELVRACEKQMTKPKVRGCAISGKFVIKSMILVAEGLKKSRKKLIIFYKLPYSS